MFAWELDMLECRLMEMDEFVDRFVFVECDLTYQGQKKSFSFEQNISRFNKWLPKINYIKATLPQTNNPWVREIASREHISIGIADLKPNDIILHGDVDEIIPASAVPQMLKKLETNTSVVFQQVFYSMAVDWLLNEPWQGTVAVKKSFLNDKSMIDIRNSRVSSEVINAGWHLSWLGGSEMIRKKAQAFSHTEEEIQSYIRNMGSRLYTEGYHVRGEKLTAVQVDNTFPRYIQQRLCPKTWFRPV